MKPSALFALALVSIAPSCEALTPVDVPDTLAAREQSSLPDLDAADARPDRGSTAFDAPDDEAEPTPSCTLESGWYLRGTCPKPPPLFANIDPASFAPLPGTATIDPFDVHPLSAVDYWEVRSCFAGFDCTAILTFGETCSGANLPSACLAAFHALSSKHGFAEGCRPLSCYTYLAGTRGDEAFVVTDATELTAFLAPFDTAAEASLLAFAAGYLSWPDSVISGGIRKVVDGWELLVVAPGLPCDPATLDRYLLHLSDSGQLTPVCRQLYRADCRVCI